MHFAKKRSPQLEWALVLLIAGAGLASCSSGPTRVDQDSQAADARAANAVQAVGANDAATYSAEVTFDKGSSQLKADSRQRLDALVQKAKGNGKVDDIKIISWADMAYPKNAKKSLPDSQQKLAEKRIDHIKDYLKQNDSFNTIDTFNMAKQPSKLSELFNTENARVKHSLVDAGVSETGIADTGASHKVGKAMVLVIMKATSRE